MAARTVATLHVIVKHTVSVGLGIVSPAYRVR